MSGKPFQNAPRLTFDEPKRGGAPTRYHEKTKYLVIRSAREKILRGYARDKNGTLILIGTIPVPINKDKCPGCLREKRRLVREAQRFLRKRWFANHPNLAARPRSLADGGDEDYTDRGPKRASIIRLASATISSVRLFSSLKGLSANAGSSRAERELLSSLFPGVTL